MHKAKLGALGEVSRLTLGGGGIGLVWGETTREEAIATLREAIDAGIDLIDTAPLYGACEAIIGEAFDGRLPQGVRITSKCGLGSPPAGEVAARLEATLDNSLKIMRLERVDLYFLHSNIAPDDYAYAHGDARRDQFSTKWSLYEQELLPAFERLKEKGKIGAWAITGVGVPDTIVRALSHTPRPAVAQIRSE